MSIHKPHLLTPEGLEKLKEELQRLQTEGRENVAERLQRAFEDGQDDDFVDNAELDAARHDQSFLEGRIQELEGILKNYQLIEHSDADFVRVGSLVTVSEEGFDEDEQYMVVGEIEADPAEGKISNESPLGKALMGSKVGDIVKVNAPNGLLQFRVVRIQ